MKSHLLLLLCGWWALATSAQIVTTSPAIVQTDSKNIVVTFHADQGNRGLAGVASSSKIYAHTGVITSQSSGPGDWRYAPTWLDNSAKYELSYAGPDTWTLTIPDINEYYGITGSGETVEKLMFVFRNATGSLEGKTANGGDISVDVLPAGFQMTIEADTDGSVINSSEAVTFTVNTTAPANIKLYMQDQPTSPIASANNTVSLTAKRAFTAIGDYTIVAEAVPVSGGDVKTASMSLVRLGTSQQVDYPGGVPVMGSVKNADGSVTFCVAAPGKESMVIVPSWNDYHVTTSGQMKYQDYNGYRYFWTTVDGLQADTDYFYYFLADGTIAVGDPYAHLVLDPWSDKYIPTSVFPDMPQYPVGSVPEGVPLAVFNSGMDDYDWQVTDFKRADPASLIIYELLLRDFTGTEGEANAEGTVNAAMDKLDYLQNLGVNAIELLPIMEFNGNNSWGYNTNFYFAPDKAYGTPDDYRRFIDECHRRGIAVILDIVFNQSDGLHPWYQLYATGENPFYNATAPHAYSVLNDWKQENPIVEQQWKDVLKYWLTVYNVDGFRFDLVKGLGDSDSYGTSSSENTDKYNATRVARMKRLHDAIREVKPDAYFINENLASAEEENEMAADGEINWANINGPASQFVKGLTNCDLNRFYAPFDSERNWASTVSYAESHDEERIAYMAANDANTHATVKKSEELIFRRLGSMAAQMILMPGAHMICQFQEFGADQTTKSADGNDTSPKKVVWDYLADEYRAGLKQTYADVIAIRNANPDLFVADASVAINCNYSTWTVGSIVLSNGDKELVLVVNPNPNNYSRTCDVPVSGDASGYRLLAASYGQSPALTSAKKVALRGCSFAVFGTENMAGVDDIMADGKGEGISVHATSDGDIVVNGAYDVVDVYDLSGRRTADRGLSSGIYIVVVDGCGYKVCVARN